MKTGFFGAYLRKVFIEQKLISKGKYFDKLMISFLNEYTLVTPVIISYLISISYFLE